MMTGSLNALDPNSLAALKRQSGDGSAESNKRVAQQFEAMFLQLVMKSMRATVPSEGMFESESTRFFQGMYDQQLAQVMAEKGGLGLAAAIERQLNAATAAQSPLAATESGELPAAQAPRLWAPYSADAQSFVSEAWQQASVAAKDLGVPTHFLVAQAALETGWGKAVIRHPDGSSSFNLFNIKAGANWQGRVVETSTLEYENGQAVRRTERFCAYDSYAESFQDYASLIGQSSRYEKVLGQQDPEGFARALQSAGYATDPAYADKLTRVINGSTLRQGMISSSR
ncbi:MAG: flagellar assembly peptidoglycan hydrolase FlgJ [Candidatus Dactylopiibacterium carminicum]|uniref:Peptidoglycan hydrolase FlgJ n=2 Tax=Candidatus Dactylopiibacterium carminicum TaxID=857335 RepID=A0A272EQF5_9RHOO|nr:flagellar assembly peptidoglycan hydrolase FlgJ [Candidatus Dactylopiibacterium carminicum]PAS92335.1 MAG: flagellar assembly peptidoglycan hydrolase FlgJ [Candidatus Dactylopiibacterium carminicum]